MVDRFSFSQATSVAAQIQDYGFGWIVGEETADLPTGYGSVARFILPRSGIPVNYPKGYLIRPSGGTAVRGVVADFPITLPYDQPTGDPGLEGTVRLIVDRRPR